MGAELERLHEDYRRQAEAAARPVCPVFVNLMLTSDFQAVLLVAHDWWGTFVKLLTTLSPLLSVERR